MNKIKNAFENGKAFVGFITAGDPNLEVSEQIILSMAKGGCDLIEIGIPFSDPIAEGPVIQSANVRSLANGTTTEKVFELTKKVANQVDTPLVYMTYLNVLFKYGYDRFLKKCTESGVSGVIIPDLPYEEKEELSSVAKNYGISVISLIAPTSNERVKMIAKESEGFIYIVSSMGVTGVRSKITTNLNKIEDMIKGVTNVPTAIGFGISTPEQVKNMGKIADGVIVGSAIVKLVEKHKEDAPKYVFDYVKAMKDALKTI